MNPGQNEFSGRALCLTKHVLKRCYQKVYHQVPNPVEKQLDVSLSELKWLYRKRMKQKNYNERLATDDILLI